MAEWISESGNVPELILCSSSERTRETTALLNETWSNAVPVSVSRELYLAPAESILRVIRSDGCGANPLMVVAHNPGLGQLICQLARRSMDVPTAAIAVFDVAVDDWSRLRSADQVSLREWVKPKELSDS